MLRIVYHAHQMMISDIILYLLLNVYASLSSTMMEVKNFANLASKAVLNATVHYKRIVCHAKSLTIDN
jgi:hypothetical protein